MINALEGDNREDTLEDYIEASAYYTMNDAYELIQAIGLRDFLTALYREKQVRLLTIEELEAMQVLHDNWEL
tara:strand:- start:2923 stop:3138 length:216 start_codon:yes stop_codon:yes gene_type:complete